MLIRNITGKCGSVIATDAEYPFYYENLYDRLNSGKSLAVQRIVFDVSKSVPTATENRPSNIALLPLIAY